MQASKSRNGSSELSTKKSPVTPKSLRASSSESDSATSKHTPRKIPIERSPKSSNRQSPKSPLIEKKLPIKLNVLESQISRLKEELKKTKDQLSLSDSSKKLLEEEAEEVKEQLMATSARLKESQLQLVEFSKAEDARLQELRKISQERDKAWQSELEALQQQHSMDSATLVSTMSEIQRLKQQLDMAMKSEADHSEDHEMAQIEIDALKRDMEAALNTVHSLNAQIREKEMAEEEARNVVSQTQKQLEMANASIETLRSEGSNLLDSLKSTCSKLEESRVRVAALEEMVKELQVDVVVKDVQRKPLNTADSGSLHSELVQLRAALEAAEARYQEEQIRNTMEIQSAYELAECMKVRAGMREAELMSTLGLTMSEISDLKVCFRDKETALQRVSEMNKELNQKMENEKANHFDSELKLMKATTAVTELNANLLDKERELQGILNENTLLKMELSKRETEHQSKLSAAISEAEKARAAAEKDALRRVDFLNGEAEKNNNRAAKAMEQLESAQAANSEMDAELRRLRVQSDQWRKAAEAAAAVLSPRMNCRVVERTGSLDSDYNSISGKLMSSPFSDDLDDESPKKKNGNMLRKIGGLWKKGPK